MFPFARVYPDHASLLTAEAGKLDFLDIATPPAITPKLPTRRSAEGCTCCARSPWRPLRKTRVHAPARARSTPGHLPCHNYKHAPVVKVVRSILNEGVIVQCTW